jgi:oligoendopeptidase F
MSNIDMGTLENLIQQYKKLQESDLASIDINDFFNQWSHIKDELEEVFAHIYIDYTCYTNDAQKARKLELATQMQEEISHISHSLAQKVVASYTSFPKYLDYAFKLLSHSLKLFKQENLPLETEISNESQKYQSLIGELQFEHEGKMLPLSMSKLFLENPQRALRQSVFQKVQDSFKNIAPLVNELFDKQVSLRHRQALNVGYKNYRDFMHDAKDRFDYTVEQCNEFGQSILEYIVPLSNKLRSLRRQKLKLEKLEPFDLAVDIDSKPALKPFEKKEEFVFKVIEVLNQVNPLVGQTLTNIEKRGGLDLFSRQNKAPGGYNYPLASSKSSFIFMNCAFTHDDLVTLFHETGHAFHFDCYKDNPQPFLYKSPPSEVAELASMSMELMSMQHWGLIYQDKEDLKRAKLTHLERIIHFFPWMAVVDGFQHWVYLNPKASINERNEYFKNLYTQFFPLVDWGLYKEYLPTMWQKQAHIIEIPFYYIEYGIAQLGALQIWDQYKKDPKKGFENYKKALSLGSEFSIKEIYNQAQIELNFSPQFIKNIAQLLEQEYEL